MKMGARWSAQGFKQACVSPSGPSAFLLLIFLKTWRTLIQVFSKLLIHLSAGGGGGGGGGVLYLVMAFRPFHTEEESLEVKCSSSFLAYILFWSFYKCNIKVKSGEKFRSLLCQNASLTRRNVL